MVDREVAIIKSKRFLEELGKNGISIKAAYLFGSYATGKQHEWSDIDVAIFSDQFSGFGFSDKENIAPVNIRKEFVEIEVKTYPSRLLKYPDPFVKMIFDKGIKLTE
jgi:predicted nucleotidyltransferase